MSRPESKIAFKGLDANGNALYAGTMNIPKELIDAYGVKRLEEYLAAAMEDALATSWPFDDPKYDPDLLPPRAVAGAEEGE